MEGERHFQRVILQIPFKRTLNGMNHPLEVLITPDCSRLIQTKHLTFRPLPLPRQRVRFILPSLDLQARQIFSDSQLGFLCRGNSKRLFTLYESSFLIDGGNGSLDLPVAPLIRDKRILDSQFRLEALLLCKNYIEINFDPHVCFFSLRFVSSFAEALSTNSCAFNQQEPH